MKNKITHKISLPNRIKNPSYYEKVIEISGEKQIFRNGEPEYLSLKDKNQDALNIAFTKIEQIAYSDAQLKSINDFFLENYRRLCSLRLYEGFQYNQWIVYKRYDDLFFVIEDVDTSSGKMRLGVSKYLFPFVGSVIDVSDTEIIRPEDFGFEYQFHLYNEVQND